MIDMLKHMGIRKAFWWTVGLLFGGMALCGVGVLIAEKTAQGEALGGNLLLVGLFVMICSAVVSFFGMICPNCGKKQLRYLPMQDCCEKCGMPFEKPEDRKAKKSAGGEKTGRRSKG